MKKSLLIFALVLAFGVTLKAQNTEYPWLVGVSTNYVDFYAVEQSFGDQFTDTDWMGKTIPSMIRVGRNINKSFNVTIAAAMVKLETDRLNEMPLQTTISSEDMSVYGVQLEYKFANDYLLKEKSWFDPYVYLGMNGSVIDDLTYLSTSMGVGFNFWVIKPLAINVQGSYDYIYDYNDYMHFSMGLVFRFGKKKDNDGDGVYNKHDLCPEVVGLAAFSGCPDTDGDGVQDADDLCPNEAGLAALAGCPDADGDGIADKDDDCPNVAGLAQYNGCPDTDGDGLSDNIDECPTVAGLAAFAGCPDTDGDGIIDDLDECPTEAGPLSNNGCPIPVVVPVALTKEVEAKLNFHSKNVQFKSSSFDLTASSDESLKGILELMNQYPESRFSIYGYTDNTGPAEFNLKLSKERAQAVKDYFIKSGVAADRLESDGFGIKNPIAPNNTKEGRTENRRVEIKLLK